MIVRAVGMKRIIGNGAYVPLRAVLCSGDSSLLADMLSLRLSIPLLVLHVEGSFI